ncbi:MAG: hypothetical protein GQ525_14355 [Draconibacterium sp.]|nr:hypothetical protein [Draconibacterium sp.]
MKNLLLAISILILSQINVFAQEQSAYFQVGTSTESMKETMNTVKTALQSSDFKIIGEYNPGNSKNLAVVCYTRPDLEKIALSFSDRGSLAAALKIGFKREGNSIKISMLNPMYLFYGYFIEGVDKQEKELTKISEDAKTAMKKVGTELTPFGGELSNKELQKYHYKMMMPYFEDAEELNEFVSFEAGLKIIQNNLKAGKGDTKKVYELIYTNKEVAVFGVALLNTDKGEPNFLPIVGEENVAAMPYEIILQGNTATILPGKFRLAISWPELTMGTFMKIMSTPGDIKDVMEGLTE